MRLEILSRYPPGPARPTPLLFVHGVFVGAWVWDEFFLPYCADRGYAAHAVSLRGHGGSEGRAGLAFASLNDYTEDLIKAIAQIGGTPVLIGHSVGGAVVQNYLRLGHAPAVVLIASVPPHGLGAASMALAWRDPLLFQQTAALFSFGKAVAASDGMRRAVLSPNMPEAKQRHYYSRMQSESRRIGFDLMGWRSLLPPAERTPPVCVIGGAEDVFIPEAEVHATARAYHTTATVFPAMGHALMLEPDWRRVANHMLDWVEATVHAPG